MGGDFFDIIAPVAGAALGSFVPGVGTAIGAAIGSGLNTGIKTGNPLAGIASAGGSYIGGQLGSSLIGDTVGSKLGSIGDALPGFISNSSIGGIAGSTLGSSLGESLFAGNAKKDEQKFSSPLSPNSEIAKPFEPKRQAEQSIPEGLTGFGALSPEQRMSSLATEGVYGGGLGQQEKSYYENLLNRQLVEDNGNLRDLGGLSPINRSYISQLGYGGNNTRDLLEAMQQWGMAA